MSTNPYYANFPVAPELVVEGLVNLIPLPGLFETHVGADNSLFLDVVFDEDHPITAQVLSDIATFAGCPEEYLFVEPSAYVEKALSITMAVTAFDFTDSFKGTVFETAPWLGIGLLDDVAPVPDTEDSDEEEEDDEDSEEEDDGFLCGAVALAEELNEQELSMALAILKSIRKAA